MAYQKILYDITALEMFKRLECLLDESLGGRDKVKNMSVWAKIKNFSHNRPRASEIKETMHEIRRMRNDIVHSVDGKFRPYPKPFLGFSQFRDFQCLCLLLDNIFPEMRMREIMIPTLKYDMGNAVDIIKHGLLAEFVAWWGEESGHDCLRFADPFAGCPWGNLPCGSVVYNRLDNLRGAVLRDIYFPKKDKYFGSSHLVWEVAQRRELKVCIAVSDNDENARRNFWVSIRGHESMRFIKDLPENDGYKILDDNRAGQYNLILIDAYSDFLQNAPEKVRPQKLEEIFSKIRKLTDNEKLFVVFVLFGDVDTSELSERAVSLRCPKIDGEGEANHSTEILLIGKETADVKLRERLQDFANAATKVLPLNGQKVEFWAGK